MINKIYKISFILLFMLFTTGLYNFCFAVTTDNKLEETDYTITSSVTHDIIYIRNVTFNFIKLNINYEKINTNNTDTDLSGLDIDKAFYILRNNKELLCLIPNKHTSDKYEYNWYCNNYGFFGYYSDFSEITYDFTIHRFYYDFSTNKWVFLDTGNNQYSFNSPYYILNDNIVPIYSKIHGTSEEFMVYEPVIIPPIEELISNCDFKVKFKFAPDNDDYPTKVDKHWYVYETCLVTHTMTNWSNYKIDMSISANKENSRDGANTYFELYNNNGDKLINKHNLENNIPIGGILSDGDFYLLLTDNITDIMTITYNIYNNYNSELLMKKVYKVKFSQGGFGSVDFTGTIIEDKTYDSNGELISGSNTGFETNGNDATTGTGSSDYYDVTDLELITNNATNTINLAKQCFSILPGFIWVMVGIFLSVCLALRILGR